LQQGINYFDTSPYYGRGRSEQVLGKALKGVDRSKYIISTKLGRYDVATFDFSASRVRQSIDHSLEVIGLEYIDIAICHDIEFVSLDQILSETIPELEKLRASGKIKYIGISGLPLAIFRYILERTDSVDMILSYCHYTMLDQTLKELLPLLEQKGVGVVNASPLSMGLLTDAGPPAWHPAPENVKSAAREAAKAVQQQQTSSSTYFWNISRLALRFSLDGPNVIATTLIGMQTVSLVDENVAVVKESAPPSLMDTAIAALKDVQGVSWPSGRAENN
jgi:L-galactose dehydrogenase